MLKLTLLYRPLDIAIKSIEMLENTFYNEFINSINTVEKYSDIKVNFYDLHNDLIFKDINNLDEIINTSDVMQNDIKLAIERERKNENRYIK